MKRLSYIFIFGIICMSHAQDNLDKLLRQYNHNNIPYITVQELAMPSTKAVILDAREKQEYDVSHIKKALFVGYSTFSLDSVLDKVPDKNKTIVVYCSLGIRSEIIASKLKKAGYTHVFNLYGGIFEWKNNQHPVYNQQGKETDSVHAFSKKWGKWLTSGHKVY